MPAQLEQLSGLLSDLGIDSALTPAELRSRLKRTISRTHPDKTGGQYRSSDQERKFIAATSALEALNRSVPPEGTALANLEDSQRALVETQRMIMELLQERRQADADTTQKAAIVSAEKRALDAARAQTDRTYRPARFGLWSLAGIAGLIAVLDKPLGGLITEVTPLEPHGVQVFKAGLALITVVGAFGGWLALQIELYKNQKVESAVSDYGVRKIFPFLLERYRGALGEIVSFDTLELLDAISEWTTVTDPTTLEATADAIVGKLEQRGAIVSAGSDGFARTFTMDPSFIEAIIRRHPPRHRSLLGFILRGWA